MNKTYYCPDCGSKLEKFNACAAINYFCPKCKELKSSKRILKEQPKEDISAQK
ncbi:zinc-ribbon domain-containing protein [Clostridium ganghwense]|uniref:Zinc-ribbon domain-containing protein n=1 Tax=Clostridium ganghwense TaxID=312089 RepID=A0ABT4CLH7_9CLOT|nr:zinc-ribbon domain-containing protein [Clostridium ganghwense]MCY6369905.1 zinc-ribbon domain-containing protein [Clostridium ganghwense]